MGLLDFIFGKSTMIENEFFGTMKFMENKKEPRKSYFECRRHFKPTNQIIEIGIDGDLSGITDSQTGFFRSIEENYTVICQAVTPLIEDEFRNWKEGFKIINFPKEFEAVYLQIPRCDTKPIVWEISFETEHDNNHTVTITMSGFEAREVLIDG